MKTKMIIQTLGLAAVMAVSAGALAHGDDTTAPATTGRLPMATPHSRKACA